MQIGEPADERVVAAAASRLAVTAQLTSTVEACNCRAMTPRTGTTPVCSTATVSATTLSVGTSSLDGSGWRRAEAGCRQRRLRTRPSLRRFGPGVDYVG